MILSGLEKFTQENFVHPFYLIPDLALHFAYNSWRLDYRPHLIQVAERLLSRFG